MSILKLYGGKVLLDTNTNSYTVSTGISTPDLNTLLNQAAPGAVFNFGAGTYHLTEGLRVMRGDITFHGAGEGKTIFEADFSAPGSTITFTGRTTSTTQLTQGGELGSHRIAVADATGLKVGDMLQINQINDPAFINQALPQALHDDIYMKADVKAGFEANTGLYSNVASEYFMQKYALRETLTEITKIEGNVITLRDGLAYAMTAGTASVNRVEAANNLHISGFTLNTNLGVAQPGLLQNDLPLWENTDSLRLTFTDNTDLHNVSILNSASSGLTARSVYHANVHDVTIIGSHNKGAGANGYGLNLAGSQQSSYDNMTIMDTRHAVLFSSWGAEVNNIVHVLETNRDINFHGSPDYGNVVTVDKSVLNYYGQGGTGYGTVSTFGIMHPFTDISANSTSFTYAIGYMQPDVIHGSDHGSYLRGGYGSDTLIGGAGNDVIIGDSHNDNLTGGGGADLFVFNNEQATWLGTDTISDFNKSEGDKLVFFNIDKTIAESQLHITGSGNDTLVYVDGLNGKALLKNVDYHTITRSDIILNSKSYSENPADYGHQNNVVSSNLSLPAPAQPEFIPADSKVFSASAKAEVFNGDTGTDTVTAWNSALVGDKYNFGLSTDTLKIIGDSAWLTLDKMATVSGLDIIDTRSTHEVGKIQVNDALVAQSDSHNLTLQNGTGLIKCLSAGIVDPSTCLTVESQGDITLADKVDNTIHLSVNNAGAVFGGTGNDTIYLGSAADNITGGLGADHFVFSLNLAGAVDHIFDYNAAQGDMLDFAKLIALVPEGHEAAEYLSLREVSPTQLEVYFDTDGANTQHGAELLAVVMQADTTHVA